MLENKICVVTGASRGVGRGIALALGELGATVYVTGRTQREGDALLPGTIHATAAEVTARGGKGIALPCDHADDDQVRAAFERIAQDSGHIDILVNNAFVVPDGLVDPGPFWEKPLALTQLLNVGMRSSYVSSFHAAPLMIGQGGLMVFTSSPGARCYMHGAAYGAGKAAIDKMAHDMAHDLRPFGVASVSLWLGLMRTERTLQVLSGEPDKYRGTHFESVEFPGRVLAALYRDPERINRSGQSYYCAELGLEYGVKDIDGGQPPSYREWLGAPVAFHPAVVE